jgi:hypothetical protein
MPFEELETITKANAPPEATVTYDFAQKKGTVRKADKKPRLTISIPTTVCGIAKSKAFKLLLGSGEDAGKLLIRGELFYRTAKEAQDGKKPVPGAVAPSEHAHFLRFNFGFVPKLGEEETFEAQRCPVRKVSDEEFEITVPRSWFEGGESLPPS